MDKPSFKDALLDEEIKEVEQSSDQTTAHALIAFLRVEGALLAGPENIMHRKDDPSVFALDETKRLRAPQEVNFSARNIYSRLSGKYDWLEVNMDLSHPSGLSLRVKDETKLLKHLEQFKKSELLDIKLKRALLELERSGALAVAMAALEQAYNHSPTDALHSAGTKAHLWGSAATTYLRGFSFDEVCSEHRASKTRYKTGDVLKAMDTDMPTVREELYKMFREFDPANAAAQIRERLARYKADAAQAETHPEGTMFGQFFKTVEAVGKTAQELIREKEKEALREKK